MSDRKKITPDMIKTALKKGWNANDMARNYNAHRSSIEAAAKRYGIVLPFTFFSSKALASRSPATKKATAVWSASPKAVERALEKVQRDKRLQKVATSAS